MANTPAAIPIPAVAAIMMTATAAPPLCAAAGLGLGVGVGFGAGDGEAASPATRFSFATLMTCVERSVDGEALPVTGTLADFAVQVLATQLDFQTADVIRKYELSVFLSSRAPSLWKRWTPPSTAGSSATGQRSTGLLADHDYLLPGHRHSVRGQPSDPLPPGHAPE